MQLASMISVWLGNLHCQSWLFHSVIYAAVEITFSQMNLIKSKLRSRMHQELLESILYVRGFMSINGLCCNSFQPTADMFAKFTTDIYRSVACSEQELEPQEIDF